jgi:hypothetical protein
MTLDDQSGNQARHEVETTNRPDTPELEGGSAPPEELTGRASVTDEDLTALFANDSADHVADGFRGGSNADSGSAVLTENDTDPDDDDDVTAA